jgi:hypothetical protein
VAARELYCADAGAMSIFESDELVTRINSKTVAMS